MTYHGFTQKSGTFVDLLLKLYSSKLNRWWFSGANGSNGSSFSIFLSFDSSTSNDFLGIFLRTDGLYKGHDAVKGV